MGTASLGLPGIVEKLKQIAIPQNASEITSSEDT